MKTANCFVVLEGGNTVPRFGVTPAEVLLLRAMHGKNAKGNPIKDLVEVGDLPDHDNAKEITRLRAKYNSRFIRAVYSGALPELPQTFESAMSLPIDEGNDVSSQSPMAAQAFDEKFRELQSQVQQELKGS